MLAKLLTFLWKDWEQARSYRLAFLFQFAGSVLTLAGLHFMDRLFQTVEMEPISRYGGNYVAFILIGIVVTLYSGTALRAFSTSLREAQVMGTLEALLLTRASLPTVTLGWAIYPFVRSTISAMIYVVGGFVILGLSLANVNLISTLVAVSLTLVVMVSLGIFAASFTLVTKRSDPFTRGIVVAAGLLSGALYPVSLLPGWLQSVSQVLPHTHAIEAIRLAVLQDAPLWSMGTQIGALVLYALLAVSLGILSFNYAMRRARVEGSLAQY